MTTAAPRDAGHRTLFWLSDESQLTSIMKEHFSQLSGLIQSRLEMEARLYNPYRCLKSDANSVDNYSCCRHTTAFEAIITTGGHLPAVWPPSASWVSAITVHRQATQLKPFTRPRSLMVMLSQLVCTGADAPGR